MAADLSEPSPAKPAGKAGGGPCSLARLAARGAITANEEGAALCQACEDGQPPGGNVDLCCLDCGHRSCEVGA